MGSDRPSAVCRGPLRHLTREEIDRCFERVAAEVVVDRDVDVGASEDETRPRWIAAGEIVRRVAPFIVYN